MSTSQTVGEITFTLQGNPFESVYSFGKDKYGTLVESSFHKPDVFDKIENVFFNSKKGITVIKWKDGSMSKSTCDNQDKFDPFVGFCIAYTTKGMSKSKLKERIQRKFKKNNNG